MDEIETAASAEGGALGADGGEDAAAQGEWASTGSAPTDEGADSFDPEGGREGPTEEELEEIERDGRRAKIPAWLKPELMMQADYTRKTQELAEVRRAFEAQRETVQQASQAELSAHANLTLIDRQIGQYSKVDWNTWHESDPFQAQKAFAQFQLLKDAPYAVARPVQEYPGEGSAKPVRFCARLWRSRVIMLRWTRERWRRVRR